LYHYLHNLDLYPEFDRYRCRIESNIRHDMGLIRQTVCERAPGADRRYCTKMFLVETRTGKVLCLSLLPLVWGEKPVPVAPMRKLNLASIDILLAALPRLRLLVSRVFHAKTHTPAAARLRDCRPVPLLCPIGGLDARDAPAREFAIYPPHGGGGTGSSSEGTAPAL
jgi:hypothetical protein